MIWKLITLVGAAIAVWSFVRRALGSTVDARPPAVKGAAAEDLVKCTSCGAWGPRDAPCACRTPPTP